MSLPKKIQLLTDSVQKMIAAGEVVEGPHSVVKELVENAIDAGATEIDIEVEEGGIKRIFVKDNGAGILPEDIPLALDEHATSKIATIDDISSIYSYGFRGEALSSISSISHLTLMSRPAELETGAKLLSKGEERVITPYAGPKGTSVIVEHLFYNTPARKKFLKSKAAEMRLIKDVVIKLALPHPEISFHFSTEIKTILRLPKCSDVKERLEALFSKTEVQSLYYASVKDMNVELEGYVSSPANLKKNRLSQYFYINNRPVDYRHFSFHLARAYDSMLPKGSYPMAALFMRIPADLVDVNVHPAKKEVKIFDSSYVDGLIYGLARKALGSNEQKALFDTEGRSLHSAPQEDEETTYTSKELPVERQINFPAEDTDNEREVYKRPYSPLHEKLWVPIREEKRSYNPEKAEVTENNDYSILGLLLKTYIIVEKDAALKLIDFHAAHERINYDKLQKGVRTPDSQLLVFPYEYTFSLKQASIVEESLGLLQQWGFDIDLFSEETLIVRAVPGLIFGCDVNIFLDEFFDKIEIGVDTVENRQNALLERIACHSSKRAGEHMSDRDVSQLVKEVFSGKYELRCPHGRPFVVSVSRNEIERLFKRQ